MKCPVCGTADVATEVWEIDVCASCHREWLERCVPPSVHFAWPAVKHEVLSEAWLKKTRQFFEELFREFKKEAA